MFFPFFSFFPRLRHMSTSSSKISANDSTDIPIQRPSDPPRSETKFASCKIIIIMTTKKVSEIGRSVIYRVDISDCIRKSMSEKSSKTVPRASSAMTTPLVRRLAHHVTCTFPAGSPVSKDPSSNVK